MKSGADIEERLLVLAPTGRDAQLAIEVFGSARLHAVACRDVAAVCREIRVGAGAVFLAEEVLTAEALQALADAVAVQEPWSDLGFVVLGSRAAAANGVAVLGNVTPLDRPLRRSTLVSVARAALRARRRQYAARELLARLADGVRQRDQFLAVLGHELRNPLAAIEMSIHLLERGSDPERRLAVARRQSRQLARLLDDLLDVARVTTGKITLRPEPVDLLEVVERSVEANAPLAAASGVEVVSDTATASVSTVGDLTRLHQIVGNLVSNAVKYTPRGGHVRVSVERDGTDAVIRIVDDGVGLAPDDLERIFEPFVQAANSIERSRGGMGLGLALVRKLVEMHGGTVRAHSAGPARGSEFVVRFPLAAPETATPSAMLRSPGDARQVLVIEDNDDLREAFTEAVASAGHEVRAAADGPSGIALAGERPVDVAFVDIGLPGIDGFEVARRLRSQLGEDVVLVALTGFGREEDRELARAAGFDLHVTKPIDVERIDGIIRARAADAHR